MTTERKALYKVQGRRRKMTTERKALCEVLGRRKKITTGLRKAAQSSRQGKAACKKEERIFKKKKIKRTFVFLSPFSCFLTFDFCNILCPESLEAEAVFVKAAKRMLYHALFTQLPNSELTLPSVYFYNDICLTSTTLPGNRNCRVYTSPSLTSHRPHSRVTETSECTPHIYNTPRL